MANSPVYRLRIEPRLKRLIDARRGGEPLSTWLRRAASQRLEAEQGLGPEHVTRLGERWIAHPAMGADNEPTAPEGLPGSGRG